MHLRNATGQPIKAPPLPFWRDHFVCPGDLKLELDAGKYHLEIERGPEYVPKALDVTIDPGKTAEVSVAVSRLIDLAGEGWWSGELHVHRDPDEVPLLIQAEDLHIAPVITWWNNTNRWKDHPLPAEPLVKLPGNGLIHVLAGEDERQGGALLYFNLSRPLDLAGSSREVPSPMKFLAEARKQPGAWIDVEKPFWWDVPVWLASGKIDSIGPANNHMCRSQMYENEAWGKGRDAKRLPPPRGNGFWTQEIYYHLLNCGLRVPPSAGSASGVLPNPVGYNRVYVHLDGELTYEKWWEGLRSGRSFVTNGPLLRCRANGQFPGHVFRAASGPLNVELEFNLIANDAIESLDVIYNGRVLHSVSADRLPPAGKAATIKLGPLNVEGSGWLLVRAIAAEPRTFRFASTAPWYLEIGGKTHVSRASARFFLDWVDERRAQINLPDQRQRNEVLEHHDRARRFWATLVERADSP